MLDTDPRRFWSKVAPARSGCWEWTASRHSGGYGQFRFGGTMVLAHRHAWELTSGLIPDGLSVCHTCDNPICVNPAHLFLGTHADNSADMVQKDRSTFGARNSTTRLTDDDVRTIRRLAADGETQRQIAKRFGVGQQTINALLLGRTWRRVA
jgi:hypothetical protein